MTLASTLGLWITAELARHYSLSMYQARLGIDSLGASKFPRIAGRRVLPEAMLPAFEAEIRRRGWWGQEETHAEAQMVSEGFPQAE